MASRRLVRWARAAFAAGGGKPERRDRAGDADVGWWAAGRGDMGCGMSLRAQLPLEGTTALPTAELLPTAPQTVPCVLQGSFRKK